MTDTKMADSGDMCFCKEKDPFKLRRYINSNDELIGTFCTGCGVESLAQEVPVDSSDNDDLNVSDTTETSALLPRKPPNLEERRAFQVQSSKTKVDLKHFADAVKPGDHISWHRRRLFWHHAIVTDVNAEKDEITLIHWTRDESDRRIKIVSECSKVEKDNEGLFNKMYRIDYPKDITKANDTELVLARARSRIGDTGYNLFTDNCESFATYCKTGVAKSHQLAWLKGKVKEAVGNSVVMATRASINGACKILQSTVTVVKHTLPAVVNEVTGAAGNIIPAEAIEHAMKGSNWIGAGIVIILESGFVIWDLSQAYGERKSGKTSRNDFIETAIQRVVEGIFGAGLAIACSLGPELIGCAIGSPLGPVGIIIGGIVGGIIGGAVGKVVGTALGSLLGKAISSSFKVDDRSVTDINDLEQGDHIVTYSWVLHPRCHAIVVDHNGTDQIKVIRNTYKSGVMEEWIPFSKPLYKVEYKKGMCHDPEKVLHIARSLLGERRYNLATYNCKTFARQCKSELFRDPEDEPWQLVEYGDIPMELLQQPCDTGP